MLVEYSNTSEPSERPDAYVSSVLVNGMWVDARDVFSDPILQDWDDALTQELMTGWCTSAAEAADFSRELARDLAYDREVA